MQIYLHNSEKSSNFAAQNRDREMTERKLDELLSKGLKQSYRKVVEQHRRDNQPLIFSENGVVQYVDPFTVAI